jgi:hypothetical protein
MRSSGTNQVPSSLANVRDFPSDLEGITNRQRPLSTEPVAQRLAELQPMAREGIEPPTRGFSVRCSTN